MGAIKIGMAGGGLRRPSGRVRQRSPAMDGSTWSTKGASRDRQLFTGDWLTTDDSATAISSSKDCSNRGSSTAHFSARAFRADRVRRKQRRDHGTADDRFKLAESDR
jgi:hypothetical protein